MLGRGGFVGDDAKDGNASGAASFVVGDTFWLELLVAGGVDGSMIDGGRSAIALVLDKFEVLQLDLVVRDRLGEECFNTIALLTSTVTS